MLHIITDSGSMLNTQEAENLKISMVPLSVTLDGQNPRAELFEVSSQEFLAEVLSGKKPATAAPAPGAFLELYQAYPNDEFLVLSTGAFISGTYNSACTARDMADKPERISVFDSYSIAGPQRGLVLAACKLKEAAYTLQDILKKLEDLRAHQVSFLSPSNINYLADGGRIPRSSVPVAKMLKAIPVLTFADFTIKKHAIKLGFDAVIKSVGAGIARACPGYDLDLFIHHSGIAEVADKARAYLQEKFPSASIDVRDLSPLGICHAGPDALVCQALKQLKL